MEEAAGADGSCFHWSFMNLIQHVEVPKRIHVLLQMVSKEGFDVLQNRTSMARDPACDLAFDAKG